MRLELPRFSAVVDPLNPARGVHEFRVDARPLAPIEVLNVQLRPVERDRARESIDYFVRGGDLAITYADRPETAMRTQIYWRAASHQMPGAIAAIELLISVQTELLDSCPILEIHSQALAERALRWRGQEPGTFVEIGPDVRIVPGEETSQAAGYLLHLAGGQFSYAQIVHPADGVLARYEARSEGPKERIQLAHKLFVRRLEKGVILRARALGLLLDRANDQSAAAAHFAAFLAAELPLTT
jgi:hypothetical protein